MTRLLILLLFPLSVLADLSEGTPLFSWTPPNEFTDGSPLNPATDLERYDLECSGLPTISIPATDTSYQSSIAEFPEDTYGCTLAAVATTANGGLASVSVPFPVFTVTAPANAAPNPVTAADVQ